MALTVTQSNEAWRLLQGLITLYKPAGMSQASALGRMKNKVTEGLNGLKRTVKSEGGQKLQLASSCDSLVAAGQTAVSDYRDHQTAVTDYRVHPLVLGPGYVWDDIQTVPVNSLDTDVSGVLVVGVNRGISIARRLQGTKLPTSYQIKVELGRATHNGWSSGKTRMKCGWRHLQSRPWLLDNYLATISASHQRQAWTVSHADMDTQEGYERALLGPLKPDLLSQTLVYSIKCCHWAPPNLTLEVVCVEPRLPEGSRQKALVDLVEEVGLRCRTVAQVHSMRCVGVGPWTTESSLLHKHWTLEYLLASISDNRRVVERVWDGERGIRRDGVFKQEIREESGDQGGDIRNSFSTMLGDKTR